MSVLETTQAIDFTVGILKKELVSVIPSSFVKPFLKPTSAKVLFMNDWTMFYL